MRGLRAMSTGKIKGGSVVLAQRRGRKDEMEEPMSGTPQFMPQEKVKRRPFKTHA
jgi:hypothetical protein